jgi:hypothetical protein
MHARSHIKNVVVKVNPVGEMYELVKTIKVSDQTYEELSKRGTFHDSFDGVIQKAINPIRDAQGFPLRQGALRMAALNSIKAGAIRENWIAPLGLTAPPTARLRNHVMVSMDVVDRPDTTVQIPFVKSFDLEALAAIGDAFTPRDEGSLYDTVTAATKERGFTIPVPYAHIEKLTEALLAELESQFELAAYRSEDKDILSDLYADETISELDHHTDSPADFKPSYLAEALGKIKAPDVGLCVAVLNVGMYAQLLENVATAQQLTSASPDAIRDGSLYELMGLKIAISDFLPGEEYYSAYIVHHNCAVLAPTRNLSFGADRHTQARKISITGSHIFADAIVDSAACVEILTAFPVPA